MQIDSYTSPDAEALLLVGEERLGRKRRRSREIATNGIGAASFLAAAVLLATIAPWQRPFSISSTVLVLAVWVLVERVKFPVAGGWTHPAMLVFVPALFVLPTPIVPLIAMLALLLRRAPDLLQGRARPGMVLPLIADAWFTLGPALVIVLTGTQRFAWSHWPVYALALVAQVLVDMTGSITWSWIGEGINPRVQLPLLTWVYVVDAILAPLGLLIAAAAVDRPALVLLALSPTAMLVLFARERKQRLDDTLALSTAYRGTAMLLGDVVEADHRYTGLHSREVVELSLAVARDLKLDATQQRNVEFGALLHDIGKIHIPKEIINKPGKLDKAEWALIRQHTIDGERMLQQVGGLLASVGQIVRASHERYDGDGYPDGLAGEAIPIEARIVSACDAFSAMTANRSYRSAMSTLDALAELRRCAGTQFDPQVVEAIERLRRSTADLPTVSETHPTHAASASHRRSHEPAPHAGSLTPASHTRKRSRLPA
jgi:putative nucleotidyltransferase with HDIG domain